LLDSLVEGSGLLGLENGDWLWIEGKGPALGSGVGRAGLASSHSLAVEEPGTGVKDPEVSGDGVLSLFQGCYLSHGPILGSGASPPGL
jgi:hypothetical protein